MGHYAFLDSFEPIDRLLAAKGVEVEAKHHIPIFWLAMFEPADVRAEPLTGVRYANREELFVVAAPYLVTDATTAMARIKRRTPALATLCGETHRKLLTEFTAFARRLKPSVMIRTADLDVSPDALRAALAEVAKLDDPAAQPASYMTDALTRVWTGADWQASEHATGLLSGWGWQVSSEERAKRAGERKWQKLVGDRDPGAIPAYAASRTFQVDELLAHPTLGAGVVLRLVEGSKIEVLFRDGPRTLVHGRVTAR